MLIKNAVCALPLDDVPVKADIRINGEKITEVALHLTGLDGEEVLDAQNLEIFPGAIDPHVHFDEPGFTHREDFFHGSMAAARGGVTSVIDMPCTSLTAASSISPCSAASPATVSMKRSPWIWRPSPRSSSVSNVTSYQVWTLFTP